jgi:hypothetical protein
MTTRLWGLVLVLWWLGEWAACAQSSNRPAHAVLLDVDRLSLGEILFHGATGTITWVGWLWSGAELCAKFRERLWYWRKPPRRRRR